MSKRGNDEGDYFSYMGSKNKSVAAKAPVLPKPTPVKASDVIEFLPEPGMEVVESDASDSLIMRIFRRPSSGVESKS